MLMRLKHPVLQFNHAVPYGAIIHDRGVQFAIFSRSATAMRLLLYDHVDQRDPTEQIEFDRETDRWGNIWSVFAPGISVGQLYHFQADGPNDPETGQRFDARARLIDPYAKALAGQFQESDDGIIRPPKCVVVDDYFDWEGDRHLKRDLSESVIYEMHVRGFTHDKTSHVRHPGTYLGVIEKIPYLQSLGVTAVELMPVHEFPILDVTGQRPERPNYWGYDPLAFFAPHRGYAFSETPGAQVVEFKQMVKALHQAGIEVILDVVFNHTCEGNENGPVLSFKGLENRVYYMLENGGSRFANYSGCGNTINGNHPIVREMIFHCLRHWVHNYHVDGFRFDLASILSRNQAGELTPDPPLIDAIAEDPMLADTKIIAEAWDAAGAYQVGSFSSHARWAEWNGRFRDDMRRFWRGENGLLGDFATRFSGSSDLYQEGGRAPRNGINFITSHDGFTLNDVVTYQEKHNQDNGEENRDGDNQNHSDHHGVEGPTDQPEIVALRSRQIKNLMATTLLSQGVPMVVAGDECRRTQQGNNNAYCQDNEISWFDWKRVEDHADLVRFFRSLVAFRRQQLTVRRTEFLTGETSPSTGMPDVGWFSPQGETVDWNAGSGALTCFLAAPSRQDDCSGVARSILMMANATDQSQCFVTPGQLEILPWQLFLDTAAEAPKDIYPRLDGPALSESLELTHKSLRVYVA